MVYYYGLPRRYQLFFQPDSWFVMINHSISEPQNLQLGFDNGPYISLGYLILNFNATNFLVFEWNVQQPAGS